MFQVLPPNDVIIYNSEKKVYYIIICNVNLPCSYFVSCVCVPLSDDGEFEVTAEMLIHAGDDEKTMEEEEALERKEDVEEELSDLQKVRVCECVRVDGSVVCEGDGSV